MRVEGWLLPSLTFFFSSPRANKEIICRTTVCTWGLELSGYLGYFQMHTYIFLLLTSEEGVDHRENGVRSLKQWELMVWRQHNSSRNAYLPLHTTQRSQGILGGVIQLSFASCTHSQAIHQIISHEELHTYLAVSVTRWRTMPVSQSSNSASVKLTSTPAKFNMNHR